MIYERVLRVIAIIICLFAVLAALYGMYLSREGLMTFFLYILCPALIIFWAIIYLMGGFKK